MYREVQEVSAMVHNQPKRSAMRRAGGLWLLAALVCLFLASAWLSAANAQAGSLNNRVLQELERTDRVIEKAREWAGPAVTAVARGHLELAIELQRDAWGEFRRGQQYYQRAAELTLKAREQALRALDAARIEKKAEDTVRRTLEQAESRVPEVTDTVAQSQDRQASVVLEQGTDHLRRARRAFLDRHFAQAARMAMLASTLIERAARLARGEILAGSAVEASIERSGILLAQVEITLLEKGMAPAEAGDYREAKRLLDEARRHFRDGQPRRALRLSLAARERALKAMGAVSQEPDRDTLAESLADLQALYGELATDIRSAENEKAMRQLERGNDLLKRARELLGKGELAEAQRHMMAAERLLRDAVESAGR